MERVWTTAESAAMADSSILLKFLSSSKPEPRICISNINILFQKRRKIWQHWKVNLGTRRLYDFIDDNPEISMNPVDYVNDPVIIAKNDNVVSINSCIQVDLMGQVASESIGLRQFSGVGGQVDFVRGAAMSNGGRSIIAMLSTAKGGTVSRIVPFLDQGAAVTTSRNDVHYVITEYGIALLKGKTLKERARALIKIAHPKFRKELREEYERRFLEPYEYAPVVRRSGNETSEE